MILLDAYALVALIAEEAAAGEVDEILRSEQAAISAINGETTTVRSGEAIPGSW